MAAAREPGRARRGVRFQLSLAFLQFGLGPLLLLLLVLPRLQTAADRHLASVGEYGAAWDLGRQADSVYLGLVVRAAASVADGEPIEFPHEDFDALKAELRHQFPDGRRLVQLGPRVDQFEQSALRWWASGRPLPPRFRPGTESLIPEPSPKAPGGGVDEETVLDGEPAGEAAGIAARELAPVPPLPVRDTPDVGAGAAGDEAALRTFLRMDDDYRQLRVDLGRMVQGSLTRVGEVLSLPWIILTLVVLIVGSAVYQALRLRRVISDPVERLTAAADAITRGQGQVRIPTLDSSTEFGVLAEAMGQMRQHLDETIVDLEDRKNRLQTLFDSMDEGALLVGPDGRVAAINRSFNGTLGLSGERALRLESPVAATGIAALGDGSSIAASEVELAVDKASPRPRVVALVLRPLRGHDGAHRGLVCIARDLTREKETEQAQNDFLSVVTHELKTPLTSIEGYTKLVLMGRAGPLTDQQRDFLQVVQRQSQTLRDRVQDLLDISRIAAGHMQYHKARVDPGVVCTKVVEAQQTFAAERGVDLRVEPPEEPAHPVEADAQRLEQVVANLVQNACKFTDTGGRVTVRWRAEPGWACVEVEDTGRGIPEGDRERIFEKFYQVEKGDTRRAGGVGLGLYICREIVTAHGGTLAVQSEPGRGSTFTARLPESPRGPSSGGLAALMASSTPSGQGVNP